MTSNADTNSHAKAIGMKRLEDRAGRGELCLLTFDKPGSAANTLDRATLEELEAHLEAIATDPALRGVILMSAKPAIFIAGADLELLAKGTSSREMLDEYLGLGQRVFNQLAGLTIPTVAAIHGACVGGGYELALACDYRIATPDKATKIGLPETRLGIVPAWGGSTRLPRLIGIPGALDIILGGKTPGAKRALQLGMIDQVAPREWLLRAAIQVLDGANGEPPLEKSHARLFQRPINRAVATAVAGRVRADVMRRTRGHYPAMLKALEIVVDGAGERDLEASLARERDVVIDLASREEARNLFRVFMLQERARKLMKHHGAGGDVETGRIERAAVIGAGVMGAGIAQWLSARGVRVILRDLDTRRVGEGMARIFKLYDDAVSHHVLTRKEARDGIDRIAPAPGRVPLGRVQLVIEAAVEKLGIKSELFRELDALTPPDAVLATNTSALPIAAIAAATTRPGRVLGLHFFNPVHKMQLVELVAPEGVDPLAKARALHFVQQIGKLPVVVRDTPGFLINRILLPYLMEAAAAFNAGASALAIDEAMLDFGMPMGPLRLVDEVGLDIALDVAKTLAEAYPDRMSVPPFLVRMVESGLLGRKSGRGFYIHEGHGAEPKPNRHAEEFRDGDPGLPVPDAATLQSRMVYRMLDEAVRCLEERVVEAPEDVDFGMIMGAGFPPFRGGVLRYGDSLGAARIVQEMERLHLTPCDRLYEMAAKTEKFYEDQHHARQTE